MFMHNEYLKALTPGSPSMEPRVDGGLPQTLWQDISAILAYLPTPVSYYARLKHEDGDSRFRYYDIIEHVLKKRIDKLYAEKEEWPTGKKNRLIRMVLSLDIAPNRCPSCRGTNRKMDNTAVVCPDCEGVGFIRVTQAMRADYIGVSTRAYRDNWQDKEDRIQSIIGKWSSKISQVRRERL